MTLDSSDPVPLWLLYEHEVDAWRATQSAAVAAWLAQQNFKAEKHRVVLLPDAAGGIAARGGRLGPARRGRCRCGMRRASSSGCRRAASVLRRISAPRRQRNCASGSPTAPIASTAIAPAKSEIASVAAPPNADVQFVALAAEALRMARDWINTPAQDFGPAELAAAARQLAERHQAAYQEWVGEELLSGKFSRHSCRRARQQRGAAAARAALDTRRYAKAIRD